MFSSWFVARSRRSSWVAKRPTLWRCLRGCFPASWGKRRRGWRSFSSVTMPGKVRSLTYNLNHVKCVLPRIGQCCIHGIPWFPIEHLQADVSRSNCPCLEWWSSWGREAPFSFRRYQDPCWWKLLDALLKVYCRLPRTLQRQHCQMLWSRRTWKPKRPPTIPGQVVLRTNFFLALLSVAELIKAVLSWYKYVEVDSH